MQIVPMRQKLKILTGQKKRKALQDRFIEGECPHCHQIARGDQCDFCGNLLNPTDLINPKAKNSNNKVEFISTPHSLFEPATF